MLVTPGNGDARQFSNPFPNGRRPLPRQCQIRAAGGIVGSMNTPTLLVTLCTYNERENLARLIPAIHAAVPHADVLVVDDNSPDGTGMLVDQMAEEDARIHVIHRAAKLGLGTALLAALGYAVEHGYTYVLNLDADFSHDPASIPALLAAMEHADVAIGSRYVEGGGVENWPLHRRLMSRVVNGTTRWALGLELHDMSGSFRCYRVSKLAELDFDQIEARGYAVLQELLFRLHRLGCRMVEVPITFKDREAGESKINWREMVAALGMMLRLSRERRGS